MKINYLMLQPYISNKNTFYEEKDYLSPIQFKVYTLKDRNCLRYIPNGCEDLLFLFNIEETRYYILHNIKSFQDIDTTGFELLGLRIRPGYEFADKEILNEIAEMIRSMNSFTERRKYIRNNIKTLLVRKFSSKDIESIIDEVTINKGAGNITDIYNTKKFSERHVNRMFTTSMGIGVKDFARYTRFQNAVYQMLRDPLAPALSHMEHLNYSDQAHYQREFKQFMGESPKKFIKKYLI